MEKWDYAELSKAAKESGGPEKYIEFLEESNRQKGREEMLPWMWITALGSSLRVYEKFSVNKDFKGLL